MDNCQLSFDGLMEAFYFKGLTFLCLITYRVLSLVPPFVNREVGVLGVTESRVGVV
jgi:hypothetical protein